jgi:hypothetical protein
MLEVAVLTVFRNMVKMGGRQHHLGAGTVCRLAVPVRTAAFMGTAPAFPFALALAAGAGRNPRHYLG